MITPVTSAQYARLRSNNQAARLALAIFRPNIVTQTTLTSAVQTNWPLSITVTGGDLSSVQRGTLIYIGSSAGLSDIGRVVARGAASGNVIPIYPVTGITWTNGLHISITDEIELRAGRLVTGTDTVTLDYGTAWSTSYRNMSPIPIMGGDVVVRAGASFQKKSDAYHPLGTAISAYSWASAGATITGGTTNNPTISYASRGNYRLSCSVTAGGVTSTGYRRVLVWDDASTDIHSVRLLGSVSGNAGEGGYSCRLKISGVGILSGGERAALFATAEYYGGEQVSMGQAAGSENIILSGWVNNITEYNSEQEAWTEFDLVGWQRKLNIRNQQYIIERVAGLETGYLQIKNPTLRSVLWHLGLLESNAGEIMDIWADDGVVMPQIEHGRAQLMAQLHDIAGLAAGTAGVDRFGRLFLTRDADINASATVTMAIESQDVAASYSKKKETNIERAVVVSAQCVPPYSPAFNIYSISPGNAHNAGDIVNIDGLAVSSQTELNEITGRYYGRYNMPVEVVLTMKQNNRLLDVFPAQIVTWQGSQYVPRSLEWNYNNDNGAVDVNLTALKINSSGTSETMTIPVAEETEIDEIEIPGLPDEYSADIGLEIPEFPTPADPAEEVNPLTGAIFLLTSGGLYYAFDLDNPIAPTWQKAGGTEIFSNMSTLAALQDTIYVAGKYYVLSARRDTMVLDYKFDPGKIIAEYGFSPFPPYTDPGAEICTFGVNQKANQTVMLVGRRFGGARGDVWVDFAKKRALNNPSTEYYGNLGEFVENKGYVTAYPYYDDWLVVALDGNYTEISATSTRTNGLAYLQEFGGTLYFTKKLDSRIWTSTDGVSFTSLNIYSSTKMGITTGLIVFIDAQFPHLRKSTDGGSTSSVISTPSGFVPRQVFVYDSSNWVVSGMLNNFVAVYKTDDGGAIWWPMYGTLAEQTENQNLRTMLVIP